VKKGSARCASSRRTPGGCEAFLRKKYFKLSYPKTQQHKECAQSELVSSSKTQEGKRFYNTDKTQKELGSQEEESKAGTFET
jgi:hypothetical protein